MTFLAVFVDLTAVVAVSTFAQLFYYGSANASALRMKADTRLYPRFLPVIGLGTCALLMVFVTPSALMIGVVCLAVGGAYYVLKEKAKAV